MNDLTQITLPSPAYQQIAEQLRQQMKSGQIKPGERLPSIAQMREKHGISRPTMDKVYSILEQESLVIRQPGSGTYVLEPPKAQTSFAAGNVIAVSGSGFYFAEQSPYWSQLMAGIRAEAKVLGLSISLPNRLLSKSDSVGGLLIGEGSVNEVLQHLPFDVPCVSLLVPVPGVMSVYADDYAGGRQATEHLLNFGHQRIGYLHGGTGANDMMTRRLSGYRDAFGARNLEVSPAWERDLADIEHDAFEPMDNLLFVQAGRETMTRWLKSDWKANGLSALLAQNDYIAIGAMEAIREHGLSTPEDISVVGFDGLEVGKLVTPSLTTIEVPLREIGRRAVQLLQSQIEVDEPSREHVMLPTKLRIGQSSAAPQS